MTPARREPTSHCSLVEVATAPKVHILPEAHGYSQSRLQDDVSNSLPREKAQTLTDTAYRGLGEFPPSRPAPSRPASLRPARTMTPLHRCAQQLIIAGRGGAQPWPSAGAGGQCRANWAFRPSGVLPPSNVGASSRPTRAESSPSRPTVSVLRRTLRGIWRLC